MPGLQARPPVGGMQEATTHELRERNAGGFGGAGQSGVKEENWENYNSIINKIYLKFF